MAKRYSKLPSDFLKISADEFQFNLLVAQVGIDQEIKAAEKAKKKTRMYGR